MSHDTRYSQNQNQFETFLTGGGATGESIRMAIYDQTVATDPAGIPNAKVQETAVRLLNGGDDSTFVVEALGAPVVSPAGGAFFWINGNETFPIPPEAIYMAGAGGQYTIVIPSHDMVVVRLGHAKGSGPGVRALGQALALLMEAVPATE